MDILKVKKLDILISLQRYEEALAEVDSMNTIVAKGRRYLSVRDFNQYWSDRLKVFEVSKNRAGFESDFMYWHASTKDNASYEALPKSPFFLPYLQSTEDITLPLSTRIAAIGYSAPIQKTLMPLLLRRGRFYASIQDYSAAEQDFLEIIAQGDTLLQDAHLELAKIALDTYCLNIELAFHHIKAGVSNGKISATRGPKSFLNTKTFAVFKPHKIY